MAVDFANITGGSWTGFKDSGTASWEVSIFDGTLVTQWEAFHVTESGSATEADPHGVYRTSFRKDYRAEQIRGFLKDGSGNYIRLAKDMGTSAFAGGQIARISAATIVRRTVGDPQNVTGSEDKDSGGNRTINIYRPGLFIYQGSYEGWIQETETPIGLHTNDPNTPTAGTLTLPMGTADLSGDHIIQRMELGSPFRRGGPVPFRANFIMTGTVTRTDTPFEDFSSTIGPGFGDMAINLSNGQAKNATWLFSSIQVDLDYQRGGPIPVRANAVANGEVT